jgi:hypothetical protein
MEYRGLKSANQSTEYRVQITESLQGTGWLEYSWLEGR